MTNIKQTADQEKINLEYLNHVIRNGTANIGGCLKEIEEIVDGMNVAIKTYNDDVEQSKGVS